MGPAPAGLIRRQITLAPGSVLRGAAGAGGELWFVITGSGRLLGVFHPGGSPVAKTAATAEASR